MPAAAVSAQPALPVSTGDPTRASLAAQGATDDLWFLAPQAQADASGAATAEAEEGPSTISTLFWTVMTGLLVVALVLAFLHFLTGVFR
jgi:hypothetical protein